MSRANFFGSRGCIDDVMARHFTIKKLQVTQGSVLWCSEQHLTISAKNEDNCLRRLTPGVPGHKIADHC